MTRWPPSRRALSYCQNFFKEGTTLCESQVFLHFGIVVGKLAPGEPRWVSLDSPRACSNLRTTTSQISLKYRKSGDSLNYRKENRKDSRPTAFGSPAPGSKGPWATPRPGAISLNYELLGVRRGPATFGPSSLNRETTYYMASNVASSKSTTHGPYDLWKASEGKRR